MLYKHEIDFLINNKEEIDNPLTSLHTFSKKIGENLGVHSQIRLTILIAEAKGRSSFCVEEFLGLYGSFIRKIYIKTPSGDRYWLTTSGLYSPSLTLEKAKKDVVNYIKSLSLDPNKLKNLFENFEFITEYKHG